MNIKPAKNTIVCENPPESKTKSGVIIAEGEDKKPELGVVLAIGEAGKNDRGIDIELPLEVKVGDTIVFRRYSANRIYIKGKEYSFIDFKDVVGVLGKE